MAVCRFGGSKQEAACNYCSSQAVAFDSEAYREAATQACDGSFSGESGLSVRSHEHWSCNQTDRQSWSCSGRLFQLRCTSFTSFACC